MLIVETDEEEDDNEDEDEESSSSTKNGRLHFIHLFIFQTIIIYYHLLSFIIIYESFMNHTGEKCGEKGDKVDEVHFSRSIKYPERVETFPLPVEVDIHLNKLSEMMRLVE